MSSVALLHNTPDPQPAEIAKSLQGNICRCGTHPRIIEAVTHAAKAMRQGPSA
jgi:aerobic-type carbon monoxide dehydrogenase small subunit (CoxS/CutS family)